MHNHYRGANTLMGLDDGCFDGHTHVFLADLPMSAQRRYTPGYDATFQDLCGKLRQYQLHGAILVQPSFLGTDNSFLLTSLKAAAELSDLSFRGVVVLDPAMCRAEQTDIATLAQQGVIGLRLNLYGKSSGFDINQWDKLLRAADNNNWHVELHCESARLSSLLPALIGRVSRVVLDHFGLVASSVQDSGFEAIMNQPPEQIWIKASAPYRVLSDAECPEALSHCKRLLRFYADHIGPEHILWGSDWPFTQFEHSVSYADVFRWRRAVGV